MLQQLCIHPVLGAPGLDTVLQLGPREGRVEGDSQLPASKLKCGFCTNKENRIISDGGPYVQEKKLMDICDDHCGSS